MTHVAEGGLTRLIETEARLAQDIAAVEREAATILAEARSAAEQARAGSEASLEGAIAELARRVSTERDAENTRIRSEADARCRRLRELPAGTVDRLAAWVESRVFRDEELEPS